MNSTLLQPKPTIPWAVITNKNLVIYVGMHTDEEDVWRIWLGWPSDLEIAEAKLRGLKAVPITELTTSRGKWVYNAQNQTVQYSPC